MANHHFGKISEVWKHLVLAEVLRAERPRSFAETHAGSAAYPLTRTAERTYGVYRFAERADSFPELADSAYSASLPSEWALGADPPVCPGSPMVAMRTLGSRAEYLFCDVDPESVASIERVARELGVDRVRAELADGLDVVWRAFEAGWRGFLHVDPFEPFEPGVDGAPSAIDLAAQIALAGVGFAYWFGYEAPQTQRWAWDAIAERTAGRVERLWCSSLAYVEPETESGIVGSGVIVANVEASTVTRCETLGVALEGAYRDATLPSGERGSVTFSSWSLD